jgi:pimeloyl-ACP methyl ester carboxylesterase
MNIPWQFPILMVTMLYQAIAVWCEAQKSPIQQRIDIGGYALHLYSAGEPQPGQPTIVIDHSLGGVEGYLLIDELATLGRVVAYDRAGYGWSDRSPHPRTSQTIVAELNILLTKANIQPPYILVGDSFGSYNVRLYAQRFPEKVAGLVLTDGLHEAGMLKMSVMLRALQLFFVSGFVMSVLGSALGIVRTLRAVGVFGILKPELRRYPKFRLNAATRSFCRPKHWLTMSQEMLGLDASARQMKAAPPLGDIPIVSIKAASFFKPSWWTRVIPLGAANRLRDEMHLALLQLSPNCTQLQAQQSGHFVWIDQPAVIVEAVNRVISNIK